MPSIKIPKIQKVALVRELGGPIEFVNDYPVKSPGQDEVLAKVLYTGVCQSDLHTARGTAAGPDGKPITAIKLPHIGGHEGVGRIVALGPGIPQKDPSIHLGALVGIRFSSRICRRCDACLAGTEQYCTGVGSFKPTNHLHHEDGAFQEYVCLDAGYLTLLPQDVDPMLAAPTLCAGLTAYKAVLNASLKPSSHLVVLGAGGGLGHYAVQYGLLSTPFVCSTTHGRALQLPTSIFRNQLTKLPHQVTGIDTGPQKRDLIKSLGANFIDYKLTPNLRTAIDTLTSNKGACAVIVTAGTSSAFATAASLLRTEGTLCCIGIPPGGGQLSTPVSEIVIKGLTIKGNLVGNLGECLEAVELVRKGKVVPRVLVREFGELGEVYGELERGDVVGRVVLRVGEDPDPGLRFESRL